MLVEVTREDEGVEILVEQTVGWGLVEMWVKVVWEDKDVRPRQSEQ